MTIIYVTTAQPKKKTVKKRIIQNRRTMSISSRNMEDTKLIYRAPRNWILPSLEITTTKQVT